MASLDFPTNPTNGQSYSLNGISYTYNGTIGGWITSTIINPTPFNANTVNTQVIFNDSGVANGSSGLIFDRRANTLTTNTLSAYQITATQQITSTQFTGTNINVNQINGAAGETINTAFNTANAAFVKANNSVTSSFAGVLTVTGNVAATVLKSNTIQSSAGTNYIVDGYPRMPGQVIEYLASPCDGSTITGASGSYVWPNVTGIQAMTTAYAVITGSSIMYTPPAGTSRVVYEFDCSLGWADAHAISHWRLYLAGVEVLYARVERGGYYPEDRARLRWIFNIGGVDNTNTGRVATWTTGRIIQWQARDYSGANRRYYIHSSQYWDGGGAPGTHLMMPTLSITAIA